MEPPLPGYYLLGEKCLAQGHKAAEVGFKPPTSCIGVLHSTTEPSCSPCTHLLCLFASVDFYFDFVGRTLIASVPGHSCFIFVWHWVYLTKEKLKGFSAKRSVHLSCLLHTHLHNRNMNLKIQIQRILNNRMGVLGKKTASGWSHFWCNKTVYVLNDRHAWMGKVQYHSKYPNPL